MHEDKIKPLGLLGILAGVIVLAFYFALDTKPVHKFIHKKISDTISHATRLNFDAKRFKVDGSRFAVIFEKPSLTGMNGEKIFSASRLEASLDPLPLLWGDIYFDRFLLTGVDVDIKIVDGKIQGFEKPEGAKPKEKRKSKTHIRIADINLSDAKLNLNIDDKQKLDMPNIRMAGFVNSDGVSHIEVIAGKGALNNLGVIRPIGKFAVNMDYEENWFNINDFTMQSNQSKLFAKGRVSDDFVNTDGLTVKLKTPLDIISFFFHDAPVCKGDIEVQLSISDWLKYPSGEASVKLTDGTIDDFVLGNVETDIILTGSDKIHLHKLKIQNAEGEINLTGDITRDEDVNFSVEGRAAHIHFGKLLENLTVARSRADFMADVEFKVGGHFLNDFKIEGDAKVDVSDFRTIKEPYNAKAGQFDIINVARGRVETHFLIDKYSYQWMPAFAKFGRNKVKVTGGLYFNEDDGICLICESDDNFYLDDVGHIAGFPVSGKGKVLAIIRGPYSDPSITGRFNLANAHFQGHPLGAASGRVYFKGSQLHFPLILGKYKDTSYDSFFEIDFDDDTNIKTAVKIPQGKLEQIFEMLKIGADLPEMSGDFSGKTNFSYKADKSLLSGSLKANMGKGSIVGQKFDKGRIAVSAKDNHLFLDRASLRRKSGELHLAGEVSDEGKLNMTLRSNNLNASHFSIFSDNALPALADMNLLLFISGTVHKPLFNGRLRLKNISYDDISLPASIVTAVSDNGVIHVNGNFYNSQASFGWTINQALDYPFRGWAQLNKFALHTYLLPKLAKKGEADSSLSGFMQMFGKLSKPGTIKGVLKIKEAMARLGPLKTENPREMSLRYKNSRLYFDDVALAGEDLSLNMNGSLPLKKEENLSLFARGNMKLGWINHLGLDAITLMGDMGFDASIGGGLEDPTVLGNATLIKGVLKIPDAGMTVNKIDGKVVFSQNKLILDGLAGNVGNGIVKFSGYIPLLDFSSDKIAIVTDLQKVPTNIIEDIPADINGRLNITGAKNDRFKISGELTVDAANYNKDWDFNRLSINKSDLPLENPEDTAPLDLDIALFIPETLKVENNMIATTLAGKLVIQGDNIKPIVTGALSSNKGRFIFRQTEFAMQMAELQFNKGEPLDPKIEMQAFADINEHRIFVRLHGNMSKPQIEYSSAQGLSTQDINHLIMFGITPEEAENIDDMALSQTLGFEMLATIAGVDRVVRQLKLESFTVSSRFSDISRTTEPYLNMVVKPYKNLRFIYSSSLYNFEDRKAEMRLKLGDITSLSGEYVNQSELADTPNLGLDLKFRWEF